MTPIERSAPGHARSASEMATPKVPPAGFSVRGSPEFEDWHRTEAERFRRLADDVLARLVYLVAATGNNGSAVELAERRVALDPLNESAHRMAMLAEAWAGRRSGAIARYRDAVRILESELGVPPLPETTELYERIRKGERPDQPGPPARTTRDRRSADQAAKSGGPMVGREADLAAVLDGYRAAAYSGRLIVIDGEAGIGKTRLVTEALSEATAAGGRVAFARCHEGERDLPYAPLAELLRGLLDLGPGISSLSGSPRRAVEALVPEAGSGSLDSELAGPGEGPEARVRFFEALRAAIKSLCGDGRPALVAIDDVHLADQATAEFVAYLTRRISRLPLALVLTWRRDEVPVGGPLPSMLSSARRDGDAHVVSMGRLDDSEVARLIRFLVPGGLDDVAYEKLVRQSEGVPFFAVEYARAVAAGELAEDGPPEQIRTLLRTRLERASDVASQVVAAASVIGRAFTPQLLRDTSGRSDAEVAAAVDELESMSLLDRTSSGHSTLYDFANDNLRSVAYEMVGAGRRRLLHRRVSRALSRAGRRSPAQVGEAAHHAEVAGEPQEAAEFYAMAGDLARAVYANTEAVDYFNAALTLGYNDIGRLREALGDLGLLAGDYRNSISEYEGAAAVLDGGALSAVEQKLGNVYSRLGDWQAADSYLEAALTTADDLARVGVLSDLAVNGYRSHRRSDSVDLADEALSLAHVVGNPTAIARASNVAGLLARSSGDLAGSVARFEASRDLAEAASDEAMLIAALNNLGLVHGDLAEHEKAERLLEAALTRCRAIGDRHREAALLSNLGDAQFALGRQDDAAASVKRSAQIMSEIGVDGDTLIPEVWKLTEW